MKKITKILAAAAVLACGLILSGCAAAETIKETVVENVNGSYNQWYKYNKTVNVPLLKSSDSDDLDEVINYNFEKVKKIIEDHKFPFVHEDIEKFYIQFLKKEEETPYV